MRRKIYFNFKDMRIKPLLVTLAVLVSVTLSNAQRAEAPDFKYELGANINEMNLTQGGTLVVATNDGLVGIKPGTNTPIFNFTEYGRVKPEELTFVPNAPYVMVGQTGFAAISTKKAVIDYMSGKVLFTTENNGWKQVNICQVLMPANKLVVSGQRKAKDKYASAVAIYDLNTGNQTNYYTFRGKEVAVGVPLLLSDGVIIPTNKGLMKVNMDSGNVVWENDVKNVGWLTTNADESDIYTFSGNTNGTTTKIMKISKAGKVLWKDEVKVKGQVANFEILPQGIAMVSNVYAEGKQSIFAAKAESTISFLDANTGDDLWDKAPKTKGYVQHFYIMDDGILFGIHEGGINKVSFDGKTLFKKPLKTGENILTMAETPQGLLYITSEDANIVNLTTGDQVWSKSLKYKRADYVSSDYDSKNKRYLISADETVFSIDENSGESNKLVEVDFEGKESPSSIEVRENGILLTSDQNMMMLDWQSVKNWHEYKRAPGKSAFGAIIAGVTAVASAGASMAGGYAASQNTNRLGRYTDRGQRYADFSSGMANASGASVSEMLKRFKATSATRDAQFILTKLDDGVGLVKLNKDTGALEKEIVLKDKKPEYQVDGFGGVLYYKANNNTIYAYNLK
jgi:hypothetical protein